MNKALGFGMLGVGGIFLTKAITGSSFGDIVQGRPGSVSQTGANLASSGVGGVGQSIAGVGMGGAVSSTGAVNPFSKLSGFSAGRTDQGVDVTGKPGSPILAPFAGTITAINQDWFGPQPQIVLEGAGQFAGRFFYVAEQIIPGVHVGQQVQAGQTIGTYASSGTGLEAGWAANPQGETLAAATPGYSGDQSPQALAAGGSFRQFLRSLGAPV